MTKRIPLTTESEWTFDLLDAYYEEIQRIGKDYLKLDTYPAQIEIISAEQMLDLYSSVGLPISYGHWSYGKEFVRNARDYKRGNMGLAYEIVTNTSPCLVYCMEENTMCMQILVMAHAGIGHNAFFKNNYMFKQWTDAESIVDYLIFAKRYISDCEAKYGFDEVEEVLDSCHALQSYGVDKYKHPSKISVIEEEQRQQERADYLQTQVDDIWRTIPNKNAGTGKTDEETIYPDENFPKDPEENILYFIEKNAPNLPIWKREIIRIVRKISQYFYPQKQCLTGNHLVATRQGLIRLDDLITEDGYRTSNFQLLSENDCFENVSHTYLKRQQRVIKITTISGRIFKGTIEHPLNVYKDGQIGLQELGDLVKGDYLITELNSKIFPSVEVSLHYQEMDTNVNCKICGFETDYLPTHITQTHKITTEQYRLTYHDVELSSLRHRRNKSKNQLKRIPKTLSPSLSELLAYLIKGSTKFGTASLFSFSYSNKDFADRCSHLLDETFGLDIQPRFDDFGLWKISGSSWELRTFLEQNFNDIDWNSNNIQIPKLILRSPKLVVSAFIRGLVDVYSICRSSIGFFEINGYHGDEFLFQTLKTLLHAFGIISKIKLGSRLTNNGLALALNLTNTGSSEIETISFYIANTSEKKFSDEIGSSLNTKTSSLEYNHCPIEIIPDGHKLLKEVLDYVKDRNYKYTATIENFNQISYKNKIKNNLQLQQQSWYIALGELPVCRRTELTISEVVSQANKFENLLRVDHPSAIKLYNLSKSLTDKFYDKIESIEDDGLQDVFDVTVPSNHLFLVDSVISHNTKVANEGFACFVHYTIMQQLREENLISDGFMLEFLASHTGVIGQYPFHHKHYTGINPYALGFAMFMDIKRICEDPTPEDKRWFPDLAGSDWRESIHYAFKNFKDESFILQYLSPKVMRDLKLFNIEDFEGIDEYIVSAIHDDEGYKKVRTALSRQYELTSSEPNIQVYNVDRWGDRTLILHHHLVNSRYLDGESANEVLRHTSKLWGFAVKLETIDGSGRVKARFETE